MKSSQKSKTNYIRNKYINLFSFDANFQRAYLYERNELYSKIVETIEGLKISSLIDIGCAYGNLVEIANKFLLSQSTYRPIKYTI